MFNKSNFAEFLQVISFFGAKSPSLPSHLIIQRTTVDSVSEVDTEEALSVYLFFQLISESFIIPLDPLARMIPHLTV